MTCMWFSGRGYCLLLHIFSSKTLLIHLWSKTSKFFFHERWWDGIWKTALCVSLGKHMYKCMNIVGQGPWKHDANKDSGLANPVQLLFTVIFICFETRLSKQLLPDGESEIQSLPLKLCEVTFNLSLCFTQTGQFYHHHINRNIKIAWFKTNLYW